MAPILSSEEQVKAKGARLLVSYFLLFGDHVHRISASRKFFKYSNFSGLNGGNSFFLGEARRGEEGGKKNNYEYKNVKIQKLIDKFIFYFR